ncbi:MAG TPA: hypothetical protein VER96_10430 [Polyangiaceae bacterium]|nr:hypothetical protein [Polyangiaceae bacterium]
METLRRYCWALLALLALAGVAWLLRPRPTAPEAALEPAERSVEPAPAVVEPPAQQTKPAQFTREGVPIRPAGSAQVDARGMAPHPLTPQHQRIFRENNLIGDLNGAMDVNDAAGLRALLAQYREEYPEDAHMLQDGYGLIADCIERPGAETRAAAQRYYDEELDSGLRRYIRRHCLETAN